MEAKMNENERQVILWDKIIRLAFNPRKPTTWLSLYVKNLNHIFEDERNQKIRLAMKDSFNIEFHNLQCSFDIKSKDKYVLGFYDLKEKCCRWHIDVDSQYASRNSLLKANDEYPMIKRNKNFNNDLGKVLDGMIFHPRSHTHIEKIGFDTIKLDISKKELSTHDIRVAGNIENPYLFLFHLQYQFCIVSNYKREEEKKRIITLFDNSLKYNSDIKPKDLFGS